MSGVRVTIGGDLSVGRLGLGTMSLTGAGVWGPPARPQEARALLVSAVDGGVDLIDTADSYGPGAAESLVADALFPYRGTVVATKGGLSRQGPRRWGIDCRPDALRAACEGSLRRLRLETIDLYYVHTVDPNVPLEESLGAIAELRERGKIRHIGVSNVSRNQLERALECVPVAAVQNRLSLADRSSLDVLALCERRAIPFVAWAPLAKGGLARRDRTLGSIAAKHGVARSQVALAWLLACSPVVVAIPGTCSAEHLVENLGATAVDLDALDVAALRDGDFAGSRRPPRRRRVRGRLARVVGRAA